MFAKLFAKAARAVRQEDHVWTNDAARTAGFVREAVRLASEGRSILVVTRSTQMFQELAAALSSQHPGQLKDLFGQTELSLRLDQAKAITIALSSALPHPAPVSPRPAASHSSVPVEILVLGRHDRRTEDDAILAFADSLGTRARVTFHLSFEDHLLKRHAGAQIKVLLEKLGMSQDEAIAHSMVTRAIEKAQRSL
jgi:preprotein translocase subunit SecA